MAYPEIIAVELVGSPPPGTGPHDVALSIIKAVFNAGFVKNKTLEFIGPGIASLSQDFRNTVDVMTTETAAWSSIWETDGVTRDWLAAVGREHDFTELRPLEGAYYDGALRVDLSRVTPNIALPFHPANVFSIADFTANMRDILFSVEEESEKLFGKELRLDLLGKVHDGGFWADDAVIAGCSGGTPGNIEAAARHLRTPAAKAASASGKTVPATDRGFSLSVYPDSQAAYRRLLRNGTIEALLDAGVVIRSAFCGPCFGAGGTPANGAFSIRHTTRNFPNREGSKPGEGQLAAVALMDARSIAATARNGGRITAAGEEAGYPAHTAETVDPDWDLPYRQRVYTGWGNARPEAALEFGPNIKDWPDIPPMPEHLFLGVASFITDEVTTTDELIPSGETSSFRSNPLRLAEFTLGRRDPAYVGKAKAIMQLDDGAKAALLARVRACPGLDTEIDLAAAGFASAIYARKPGDGSAREQAASSQRVLGGGANFALEYATKRYRSNLLNWGMLPFLTGTEADLAPDCWVFLPYIRRRIEEAAAGAETIAGFRLDAGGGAPRPVTFTLGPLTAAERAILLAGCLINYYRRR